MPALPLIINHRSRQFPRKRSRSGTRTAGSVPFGDQASPTVAEDIMSWPGGRLKNLPVTWSAFVPSKYDGVYSAPRTIEEMASTLALTPPFSLASGGFAGTGAVAETQGAACDQPPTPVTVPLPRRLLRVR